MLQRAFRSLDAGLQEFRADLFGQLGVGKHRRQHGKERRHLRMGVAHAIVDGAPVTFMHVGRAAAAALHLRAADHPLQHANQQIALAAEVVIQRAFGESRLRGDQLGGGALEASRGEHGRRRIENMLTLSGSIFPTRRAGCGFSHTPTV